MVSSKPTQNPDAPQAPPVESNTHLDDMMPEPDPSPEEKAELPPALRSFPDYPDADQK